MSVKEESATSKAVTEMNTAGDAEGSQLPPMPESTSRITRIPPPREGTWFWYVIWGIAWFLRLFCARVVAEGRENLPATGGFVVTCNHTRGFDFVPLGYCTPRQVYFMVKAEAFEVNPILTWILYNGGGIPVQRGKADTAAMHQAIAKVNDGYPAALFPEGTRSPDGTLQAAYTGAVRIALHTETPVVPAVVVGAEEMLRQIRKPWVRPTVTVRYGAPMIVTGDPADKEQVGAETRRVMLAMAAMLPLDMRGIWADGVGRVVGAGETRSVRAKRAAERATARGDTPPDVAKRADPFESPQSE